jgi:hypothetical protein
MISALDRDLVESQERPGPTAADIGALPISVTRPTGSSAPGRAWHRRI